MSLTHCVKHLLRRPMLISSMCFGRRVARSSHPFLLRHSGVAQLGKATVSARGQREPLGQERSICRLPYAFASVAKREFHSGESFVLLSLSLRPAKDYLHA